MATKAELQQALVSDAVRRLRWEWYRQRIEQVHHRVTAYDLLRRNGISIRQSSDTRAEQVSCPFHGQDRKPSARVYPDTTDSPSHVWCYVCRKRWDVIGLQMEFSGCKFSQALAELERGYGIVPPEMPEGVRDNTDEPDEAVEEFQAIYDVCERRIRMAREAYRQLNDLQGFLQACVLLDRVYHRVTTHKIPPNKGTEVLTKALEKIGQKVRQSNV
jgi:hypothetical protein